MYVSLSTVYIILGLVIETLSGIVFEEFSGLGDK